MPAILTYRVLPGPGETMSCSHWQSGPIIEITSMVYALRATPTRLPKGRPSYGVFQLLEPGNT